MEETEALTAQTEAKEQTEETRLQPQVPAQPQEIPTDDDRLLGDLSFAQVISTAMAAATSFALSNQIGIAGSLIGAAVGAAASVVAGQVYKQLLKKSQHTIENLTRHEDATETAVLPAHAAEPAPATQESAPHKLWVIIVGLIVAALLAVGAYAAIVTAATQGEGIGDKPETIYVIVHEPAEETTGSAETAAEPSAEPETTPAQDTPTPETEPTDEDTTQTEPSDTEPTETEPETEPVTPTEPTNPDTPPADDTPDQPAEPAPEEPTPAP